jgi:hypothetical protein
MVGKNGGADLEAKVIIKTRRKFQVEAIPAVGEKEIVTGISQSSAQPRNYLGALIRIVMVRDCSLAQLQAEAERSQRTRI